jgi:hypothetical protein
MTETQALTDTLTFTTCVPSHHIYLPLVLRNS